MITQNIVTYPHQKPLMLSVHKHSVHRGKDWVGRNTMLWGSFPAELPNNRVGSHTGGEDLLVVCEHREDDSLRKDVLVYKQD